MELGGRHAAGLRRPQDPAGEVLGGGIAAAEDRAHPAARRKTPEIATELITLYAVAP
jgi:hypothetical protein